MIEEFDWTDHALRRAFDREFDRFEVEMTIRFGHRERVRNDGRADWRVSGRRMGGERFVVLYDHPVAGDVGRVRIVSVWGLEGGLL